MTGKWNAVRHEVNCGEYVKKMFIIVNRDTETGKIAFIFLKAGRTTLPELCEVIQGLQVAINIALEAGADIQTIINGLINVQGKPFYHGVTLYRSIPDAVGKALLANIAEEK